MRPISWRSPRTSRACLAISCGIDATKFANQARTQNYGAGGTVRWSDWTTRRESTFCWTAISKLDKFPNLKLRLVGDGGERERLERQASLLGISDRVEFLGARYRPRACEGFMRHCTVFVMPSIAELAVDCDHGGHGFWATSHSRGCHGASAFGSRR